MEKPKPVACKQSHFPCKCSATRTIPKDKLYPPKEVTQKRPSSANSMKSSSSRKKSTSEKVSSSDTKLPTSTPKNKTKKSFNSQKKDPEYCQQLKEELNAIKEQLTFLSDRKKEALDVTNELELRYKNLRCQCENQKKVIESLTKQSETREESVMTSRTCLDEYGEKLNCLYQEFVETSKVMEDSRNKICRCIKEKSTEYEDMETSKNELCKTIEENNEKYRNLLSTYQQSKENEKKYAEQNAKLILTLEGLEEQLHSTRTQLEVARKEVVNTSERFQVEFDTQKKQCCCELQNRENEITQLKSVIQQLQTRLCQDKCRINNDALQVKYNQLEHKYKHAFQKLNFYQQNSKKRSEELEELKKHEEELIKELVKLQAFCNTLANLSKERPVCISEKDAIIKCQKAQMACKEKQIEILRKDEDRLKRKLIELQEEVVAMKLALESKQDDDVPVLLPEEVEDLLTTLYEEIDATLQKDEEIRMQNKEICCLRCTLQSKERELRCVRNELEMLKNRFATTLQGKQAVVDHFTARRWIQYESSEEESCNDCPCNNF